MNPTLKKILTKFKKPITKVLGVISDIKWDKIVVFLSKDKRYYNLTDQDWSEITALLKPHYYFILTHRKTHMTTYLIAIAGWLLSGKPSYWTHALVNVDEGNVDNLEDFKLIESTKVGVHYSTFDQVFDCDGAVLLAPQNVSKERWTKMIDAFIKYAAEKRGYDNLFDIADDKELSCIEVIYQAILFAEAGDCFPNLMRMVKEEKNITPQMLYDCQDLKVVWEKRR